MDKIKILIISNSYILSTGLQAVLNEITEVIYLSIEFNLNTIFDNILNYTPDIIIYNEGISTELKLFINNNKYINILVGTKKNKPNYINLLYDDKSTIITLVRKIISENLNKKILTKNEDLSSREITIVKLIAQGLTNQEIADKLFLSKHTVITHRKNITNKLNIKTVSGLTVYAIINNIIDIKEVK